MISNSEMIRIRRQMQRRIRDVVAERRQARQDQLAAEATEATVESSSASDPSLVGSG